MRSILLFFLFLGFSASLFASQTVYVLFNPECMDRFEYSYNDNTTNYVTYYVTSGDSKIALEVGAENRKQFNQLPANTVSCNNPIFDGDFVESINQGLSEVYVVMPLESGGYSISPSRMATFASHDGTKGFLKGNNYAFNFDESNLMADKDCSLDDSESMVYFIGQTGDDCGAYHFRRESKTACRPLSELYYVKGIGLVEEHVGKTTDEAAHNRFVLKKVNGVPYDQYKTAFCSGNPIKYNLAPTQPVQPAPTVAATPEPAPVEHQPKRCTGYAKEGHHLVQYGETLFGIARQQGVTVKQLRSWNNLKSTKIKACSQLRIEQEEPIVVAAAPPKPAPAKQKFTAKGVAKPKVNPTKSNNGVHEVQKGESLYVLARLYGYTTEKMAEINGISPTAVLQPGMELITVEYNCPTEDEVQITTSDDGTLPVLVPKSEDIPEDRVIAAPKVTYHEVEEGETIWTIANHYGLDVKDLMKHNNFDVGEVLVPGQKVYFP